MQTKTKTPEATSIELLMSERAIPTETTELRFADLPPDYLAYNPSKVFYVKEQPVIAVRVEPRNDELASQVQFYKYNYRQLGKPLERYNDLTFPWQDPFVARVQNQLIIGGVRILPDQLDPTKYTYFTEFYIGSSLDNMNFLTRGPDKEKDIRLVDMSRNGIGMVGVYGRPQNGHATGDISFTTINNPYELTADTIKNAPIITKGLFKEGVWCGANDAIQLSSGHNLVLGHVARFQPDSPDKKEYHGIHFRHDPNTGTIYGLTIAAIKNDFPPITARDSTLDNVYFMGGIHEDRRMNSKLNKFGDRKKEVKLRISCGLGDAAVGGCMITLKSA
jgi:hypothetical protein